MKIENRIKKLELRVVQTVLCPWCRYLRRWPSTNRANRYPLSIGCRYCGNRRTEYVSVSSQYEIDAYLLAYSKQPGAILRDEKVYAATHWLSYGGHVARWAAGYYSDDRAQRRKEAKETIQRQQKFDPKAVAARRHAREQEKRNAIDFMKAMVEREKLEYGPHQFPLAKQLETLANDPNAPFRRGAPRIMSEFERITRQTWYRVLVMEICENILWGLTLDTTKATIESLQRAVCELESKRMGDSTGVSVNNMIVGNARY